MNHMKHNYKTIKNEQEEKERENTEIKNIKSKEIADYNENVQKEKLNIYIEKTMS